MILSLKLDMVMRLELRYSSLDGIVGRKST